jgi:hypothetical protein
MFLPIHRQVSAQLSSQIRPMYFSKHLSHLMLAQTARASRSAGISLADRRLGRTGKLP